MGNGGAINEIAVRFGFIASAVVVFCLSGCRECCCMCACVAEEAEAGWKVGNYQQAQEESDVPLRTVGRPSQD